MFLLCGITHKNLIYLYFTQNHIIPLHDVKSWYLTFLPFISQLQAFCPLITVSLVFFTFLYRHVLTYLYVVTPDIIMPCMSTTLYLHCLIIILWWWHLLLAFSKKIYQTGSMVIRKPLFPHTAFSSLPQEANQY